VVALPPSHFVTARINASVSSPNDWDQTAFEWLEKAVSAQDPALAAIYVDASNNPITDDPCRLQFLASIGMSPAQLDAIEFSVTLSE
jgi:hypothetical protein